MNSSFGRFLILFAILGGATLFMVSGLYDYRYTFHNNSAAAAGLNVTKDATKIHYYKEGEDWEGWRFFTSESSFKKWVESQEGFSELTLEVQESFVNYYDLKTEEIASITVKDALITTGVKDGRKYYFAFDPKTKTAYTYNHRNL
ncbi:MAG: hypothetical protein NE334_15890 [Lentisphaeraceae bacterium]|nr:hypothetical protein [Lentisphaeraceae bacterium]